MVHEIGAMVVGAGVIGIAAARELQLAGHQVVLIEREKHFGMGTSSRNSEVIHAGIYYQPRSLKARLCVEGRHLLYAYCEARGVPHRRIGKVIVAVTEEERDALAKYMETATENGVDDLSSLSSAQVQALEPEVRAVAGLLSPSTGIVDSHAFMEALLYDFEEAGGIFLRGASFASAVARTDRAGFDVCLNDAERTQASTQILVNAAGLEAPAVAMTIAGLSAQAIPAARYAIGHYFLLSGKSPFNRLVYPIAPVGGLGVHVTLDMQNAVRFGPDVEWIESIDYRFRPERRTAFAEAIRRYYPSLDADRLQEGYTGIRPKIGGPEAANADFLIQGPAVHGVPGLVNLFGIESPGLTASLAIGAYVRELLQLDGLSGGSS